MRACGAADSAILPIGRRSGKQAKDDFQGNSTAFLFYLTYWRGLSGKVVICRIKSLIPSDSIVPATLGPRLGIKVSILITTQVAELERSLTISRWSQIGRGDCPLARSPKDFLRYQFREPASPCDNLSVHRSLRSLVLVRTTIRWKGLLGRLTKYACRYREGRTSRAG